MVRLKKILSEEKVGSLHLRRPLCLEKEVSLKEVFRKMHQAGTGCVLLLEEKKIVGIFTERDAMSRVAGRKLDLQTSVESVMTRDPKVLRRGSSVAEAIHCMNQGPYRHLPILDDQGDVFGVVSVRDIIDYLAEHFPYEVYNLPPNPHQISEESEGA